MSPSSHEPSSPASRRGKKSSRRVVALEDATSLARLRDRVQQACEELGRLRAENEALAARVQELERGLLSSAPGSHLHFDEDPEALRRRVEDFVAAIDLYLEQENP